MPYTVGERIRLHPASDWFMRGVIHAVVTSLPRRRSWLYARPDTLRLYVPRRLRMRIPFEHILEADTAGMCVCGKPVARHYDKRNRRIDCNKVR